ncbi:lysophosphatidic acid receptor 6-like [Heterodontus francisci]|uniref:lysophosphatidic acid receptor 6-like n=1 Tax=Heterodontus francisci TaxID=7792 RepID=UPI00355C2ADB
MATFVSWNATITGPWSEANSSNLTGNASLGHSVDKTFEKMQRIQMIVLPCLLIFVVVLGIAGNSIALWHIARLKKVSSATDVFLLDLTITNVLVILASIFFLIQFIPECVLVKPFLDAHIILSLINIYGNPPFMTCIAIDQYIAVVHPIRSRAWRRPRYYVILSIAIWLSVLAMSLVTFFMLRTNVADDVSCKVKPLVLRPWQIFKLFSEVTFVAIPLLILLICYALTTKKLIEVGAGKESMELMKKKVLKTIVGILALLFFFFASYHIPEIYFVNPRTFSGDHAAALFNMLKSVTIILILTEFGLQCDASQISIQLDITFNRKASMPQRNLLCGRLSTLITGPFVNPHRYFLTVAQSPASNGYDCELEYNSHQILVGAQLNQSDGKF